MILDPWLFDELDEHLPATAVDPPLKWHGGKFYLFKKILALMPPHLHYVEPFFGGGQVLFGRDPTDSRLWCPHLDCDEREVKGVSEVVNDIDNNLMNFYTVLQDRALFKQLWRRLDMTLFSEAVWNAAGELLKGTAGDRIERAAALFVSVRQSRQALRKVFVTPVRGRLRGGRQDHVNAWRNRIEVLDFAHRRLQDVLILCRDALKVIESEDTEQTLFYCDPPYLRETRTVKNAYQHEMTDAQHRKLLDLLKQAKGKVILSGYPSKLYDDALSTWNRHTEDLPNNAASGSTKRRMTEVLWCNF